MRVSEADHSRGGDRWGDHGGGHGGGLRARLPGPGAGRSCGAAVGINWPRRFGTEPLTGTRIHALQGSGRLLVSQRVQPCFRLLYHRLQFQVAVLPEFNETRIVDEGLFGFTEALIDLTSPKM